MPGVRCGRLLKDMQEPKTAPAWHPAGVSEYKNIRVIPQDEFIMLGVAEPNVVVP